MSRRGIRIIPRESEPITPFTRLAVDLNWRLNKAFARDTQSAKSGEVAFLVPDSDTHVILRDDLVTGVHYFTVWGPDEATIADTVRRKLPSYTEADLLAWWDRGVERDDVDERVDAVLFMGVGAPSTPSDEFTKRVRAALADSDKDVRNAAVVGAAYMDWPAVLRADLERVAKDDPDKLARARAATVLEGWANEGADK